MREFLDDILQFLRPERARVRFAFQIHAPWTSRRRLREHMRHECARHDLEFLDPHRNCRFVVEHIRINIQHRRHAHTQLSLQNFRSRLPVEVHYTTRAAPQLRACIQEACSGLDHGKNSLSVRCHLRLRAHCLCKQTILVHFFIRRQMLQPHAIPDTISTNFTEYAHFLAWTIRLQN